MDKSDSMHFVNSVRWHCTILMKTTRLNEDIEWAVRGVCDIENRILLTRKEHLTWKINDFSALATLFER